MIKIGDKLISKYNTCLWYDCDGRPFQFLCGKSYEIIGEYRSTIAGTIFTIQSEDGKRNILEYNFDLYFFNETELRKMKLEKLTQNES